MSTEADRPSPREDDSPTTRGGPSLTRRSLLLGAGGLVVGAATGGAAVGEALRGRGAPAAAAQPPPSWRGEPVPAAGATQAGVTRPATPQPHGLLAVYDVGEATGVVDLAELAELLAAVGRRILDVTRTEGYDDDVTPDGPGDLTVTVGLGPRLVAAVDPTLPAAVAMPDYARDDGIDPVRKGGDLFVMVCGTDAGILAAALGAVERAARTVAPAALRPRWSEHGFRAPGEGTVARNPLGYLDGIRVPSTDDELDTHVWLGDGDDPRVAGGTVFVVRRLVLDVERFGAEDEERRDRVIGRHRVSGAPLSGGERTGDVNLQLKTPEGEYLTPARSHVRAAHPSFTGSHLMLRRSYTFATPAAGDAASETGLLFSCFQRDLDTFVRTQLRLDEADDLMGYVTPTGTGSFLVLPGFDADHPLGASLFG